MLFQSASETTSLSARASAEPKMGRRITQSNLPFRFFVRTGNPLTPIFRIPSEGTAIKVIATQKWQFNDLSKKLNVYLV
jgi:hypothetical protein